MDRFYLDNATLYQTLVKRLQPGTVPQMTKSTGSSASPNITVSARIRPLLNEDATGNYPCAVFPRSSQDGVVDIHDLYNHPRGRPVLKSYNYQVNKLFDQQTTTEEIYDNLVADLVPYAWNGGVGTLFAYGQTGSGKTYTISKLEELVADSLMGGSLDGRREVYITIIDLAGNSAFDLLNSRKPISVLEDSFGVTQLAGALEHLAQSRNEMRKLIVRAATFRRTAPTMKNDASSRSHGICRIRIKNPATNSDGLLYLVDLAGSEAARDVSVHGADRMRETREINMSLSVLKDCIRGKVESDALMLSGGSTSKQKRPHVPFRQSTLTKVLKHVFDPTGGRTCKTVVIACVNPSLADVGSSKNTLRYAELLRVLLPTTTAMNTEAFPTTWKNTQLRNWIAENSGTPPISPALLAPNESGAQLLHLTPSQFTSRCLKTPGVSVEQAKAFRSKLWQLHVDSQRASNLSNASPSPSGEQTESSTISGSTSKLSSRDVTPATTKPFKDRIRPGMVISFNQAIGHSLISDTPDSLKLAVILCPADAVSESMRGVHGNAAKPNPGGSQVTGAKGSNKRYLCALVIPAVMADAYELHLWRQVVVDVQMMDKEVFLDYDVGTRYYYISV